MRTAERDAACLRDAAWILQTRASRRTFALRVIIAVLRRVAGRIEAQQPGWADE